MISHTSAISYIKSVSFFSSILILLNSHFYQTLILVLIIFFSSSLLYSFLERDSNSSNTVNLKKSIWLNSIAMIQGELPDPPKSAKGRVLMFFNMCLGIFFVALITSVLTTSLVSLEKQKGEKFKNLSNINSMSFLVEKKSLAQKIIRKHGGINYPVNSTIKAFDLYYQTSGKKSNYDGVVGDMNLLYYLIKKKKIKNIEISPLVLTSEEIVFGLQKDSPYFHDLNKILLRLNENEKTKAICEHYVPLLSLSNCLL